MAKTKSIIITGASRGIGLAIARFLLKGSHKVFLVARTAAPLEKLKNDFPGQVEFLAGDLKDFEVCSPRKDGFPHCQASIPLGRSETLSGVIISV